MMEDSLYLSCHGDSTADLPLESQITVFVYAFCQLNPSTCKLNFVTIEEEGRVCSIKEFQIPETVQFTVTKRNNVPTCVQHCTFPVLLLKKEYTNYICCGLANILRNLIYKGNQLQPERKLNALLGYNETCLKACAESSQWTNLCEVGILRDVDDFIRQGRNTTSLPSNITEFEHTLTLPVAMFNINKKRREVLKKKLQPATVTCQEDVKQSPNNRTDEKSVMETVAKIQDMQISSSDINNSVEPCSKPVGKDDVTAKHPHQKKHWKVADDCLPELPHLFAEGFEETISDVVLFPSFHLFLSHIVQNNRTEILEKLPHTVKWYDRTLTLPYVSETAKLCGMTSLTLPSTKSSTSKPNSTCDTQPNASKPHSMRDTKSDASKQNSMNDVQKAEERKSRKVMKTSLKRTIPVLLERLETNRIHPNFKQHPSDSVQLQWSEFPTDVRPVQGGVTELRTQRKCQQVENIVSAVLAIAKEGDTIVDFCCGSGHVGITLAHLLPRCHIYLLENKVQSLDRALIRISNVQLKNVTLYHGNLNYFQSTFDIGVSLHACGVATDMVLDKCISSNAAFVSAPCCYGSMHSTHVIRYPRSKKFQQLLSEEEYVLLGHAADQTPWNFDTDLARQGKKCMGLIDGDRLEAAKDNGYQVTVCTMKPPSCSPKNDLLIGIPPITSQK